MATSTVETLFTKLETQKQILTKCTDLYKSLNTHFNTLDETLTQKSLSLTTQLETLSTNYQKALDDLSTRETSLPSKLHSLSSQVETLKEEGLREVIKVVSSEEEVDLREMVRGHCRKMDGVGLVKTVISKRRETGNMRGVIREGLEKDCVDAARLVVEVVREFLSHRKDVKKGAVLTDRRWACNIIVGGLFTVEEIRGREGEGKGMFSRKAAERAEEVVREWREMAAVDSESESGNGVGMGPAEAVMFLTFVMGFGLKEKVEEEFVRKLVVEFAVRKDMAILALPFFGHKVGDVIDELVKTGKQVEAVTFACECGLTERFNPASLLKSFLSTYKENAADIRSKGDSHSDEAYAYETSSIKSIIKCVEENKLEAEFSVESLRKELSKLERTKADKKKNAIFTKPSKKRSAHVGRSPRVGGPPPPRPAKVAKYSDPYPRRNPVTLSPTDQSLVSRYLGPYNYPSQSAYDTGLSATTYAAAYGQPSVPPAAPISQHSQQPAYAMGGSSVSNTVPRLGGSYGGQYASTYDYGAAATHTYQPPSYTQ